MSKALQEMAGLRVTVDRVEYSPDLDAPEDRPHPFVYHITIHNESDESVTIVGRKWVVTDASGFRTVVEGEGVVGKTPELPPGGRFSYNSYHVVAGDSLAEGAYIGVASTRGPIITRIPPFELKVPCP